MRDKETKTTKDIHLSSTETVKSYEDLVTQKNKKAIADFVRQRFTERYIAPFSQPTCQGAFAMVAAACLMIETLESFYRGWETTERRESEAFKYFLKRETHLGIPEDHIAGFYKGVRCGILHQGETTRGWTLTDDENTPIFDKDKLCIQAGKFLAGIATSLESYAKDLETKEWDSETWDNFRRKMRAVIRNCEGES